MLITVFTIAWLACGVLSYGLQVAHMQRKYHIIAHETRITDRVFSGIAIIFGPIALFATLVTGQYKYGWML